MRPIPLDKSSLECGQSALDFSNFQTFETSCHLTWRGFYDCFSRAVDLSVIGRAAERKPNEVLRIYDRFFKHLFGDMEYTDYRQFHFRRLFVKQLPENPSLRFVAMEAMISGMRVEPLMLSGNRLAHTFLVINDKKCSIHGVRDRRVKLVYRELDRCECTAIVYMSPMPTEAVLLQNDCLRVMPRSFGGRIIRLNTRRDYPEAVRLPQAA